MANDFTPNVGSKIPKADALKWIDKFDKERKKDTKSVFFGREALEAILSDTSVTGISFFFARKNENGKDKDDLVMVGTRLDGSLAWTLPASARTSSDVDGDTSGVYDKARTCPDYCPTIGG